MRVEKPWGFYEVLAQSSGYKIKLIVVYPGELLSLQRHKNRMEHWYIIKGKAKIEIDGKNFSLQKGKSIDIPKFSWHRLSNPGDEKLEVIEIQTGNYLGEDDIERAEDRYGRV